MCCMTHLNVERLKERPRGTNPSRDSVARHLNHLRPAILVPALGLLLAACSLPNYGGYKGATTQGHDTHLLYAGLFTTAIVVGGITLSLILWSVFRYKKRSDAMPRQFQYHIPLEITYTVIPIIIVLVVFFFTVGVENKVDAVSSNPYVQVKVTAFQWGWNFDYPQLHVDVHGVTLQNPEMVLPTGKTARITLVSADVVHGFYVRQFNFSRYAQPGVINVFDLTIRHSATYQGQCTQFCGLYHAEMLFRVKSVPPAQFQAWVHQQQATGHDKAVAKQPSPIVKVRSTNSRTKI